MFIIILIHVKISSCFFEIPSVTIKPCHITITYRNDISGCPGTLKLYQRVFSDKAVEYGNPLNLVHFTISSLHDTIVSYHTLEKQKISCCIVVFDKKIG